MSEFEETHLTNLLRTAVAATSSKEQDDSFRKIMEEINHYCVPNKGRRVVKVRNIYEKAVEKLPAVAHGRDDAPLSELRWMECLFMSYAGFEEWFKEPKRARRIYKSGLDRMPQGWGKYLSEKYVRFEQNNGDTLKFEDAIIRMMKLHNIKIAEAAHAHTSDEV